MDQDSSRWRFIVENGPDGHLVFENGRCTYYSPAYHRVVRSDGKQALESEHLSLKELLHPDDQDRVLETFAAAVADRVPSTCYAYRGRTVKGSYHWREDNARLFYDENGNHTQTLVVARDIEERRLIPVAEKSDFKREADDVSIREIRHRVKNDFELVRSMLSLQAREVKDRPTSEIITSAADRVGSLGRMYDLLYRAPSLHHVDADALLMELLPDLRRKADLQGNRLQHMVDVAPGTRISIPIARTISIVLNELITNSLKYASSGEEAEGITLRLVGIEDANRLLLKVADSGPGFPSLVVQQDELGFGLTVVRSMVESHNGTLRLLNSAGATAEIELPLT